VQSTAAARAAGTAGRTDAYARAVSFATRAPSAALRRVPIRAVAARCGAGIAGRGERSWLQIGGTRYAANTVRPPATVGVVQPIRPAVKVVRRIHIRQRRAGFAWSCPEDQVARTSVAALRAARGHQPNATCLHSAPATRDGSTSLVRSDRIAGLTVRAMRACNARSPFATQKPAVAEENLQRRLNLHGDAVRIHGGVGGHELEGFERNAFDKAAQRERRPRCGVHPRPRVGSGSPSGTLEAAMQRHPIERRIDRDGIAVTRTVVTREARVPAPVASLPAGETKMP